MLSASTLVDVFKKSTPIDSIAARGHCWTPRGLHRYTSAKYGTYKPMVRVVFSNKKELICTPDHRLVDRGGWILAGKSLSKYCLIMSSLERFVRVIQVQPLESEEGWTMIVDHHEHRFNVNGGIVVADSFIVPGDKESDSGG